MLPLFLVQVSPNLNILSQYLTWDQTFHPRHLELSRVPQHCFSTLRNLQFQVVPGTVRQYPK
jgi:hypothetical protein